jgi:two-component system LytT family response regulator
MFKALLVDDEELSRNTLRLMLSKHCPDVEIIGECQNAFEATEKIKSLQPDVCFLDISMPEKSGIDLLRELEEINFEIIFVTAHEKYALQALQMAAVDYLLKPVSEEQLIQAVNRAHKRIQSANENVGIKTFIQNIQKNLHQDDLQLCIPTVKGFQVVFMHDVIYCEADNTYTYLHLKGDKRILSSKHLSEYEKLLADANFVRIHKSYLINMKHIKEYQKGEGGAVIMTNGSTLDVSRRKKEEFINKVKQHFK